MFDICIWPNYTIIRINTPGYNEKRALLRGAPMTAIEIISKKRDRHPLTEEEITFMVSGFDRGIIPAYQMSSFLMAAYLRGLNEKETVYFTRAIINSGKVLNFSCRGKSCIDKHSTGGVGDKISIVLAPLAAAGGLIVPMASGRALGHTGGTIDKLESIPGFRTQLTTAQIKQQLAQIGVAMVGQTPELAPADGKIYALRDVTATVESIPLTSASIMGKKLAEGIDGLVLDVKVGTGAFMKTMPRAVALARAMINIGRDMGKRVVALITDMNHPIGYAVGNILEIKECIEVLKGKGPEDTRELSLILTGYMFYLGNTAATPAAGKKLARRLLDDGSAYRKFIQLVKLHGGKVSYINNPDKFPQARIRKPVPAPRSGYISKIDSQELGLCCNLAGAGRITMNTPIDYTAGLIMGKKTGAWVKKGEPLVIIHTNKNPEHIIPRITRAFSITKTKPKPSPLVHKVYGFK